MEIFILIFFNSSCPIQPVYICIYVGLYYSNNFFSDPKRNCSCENKTFCCASTAVPANNTCPDHCPSMLIHQCLIRDFSGLFARSVFAGSLGAFVTPPPSPQIHKFSLDMPSKLNSRLRFGVRLTATKSPGAGCSKAGLHNPS